MTDEFISPALASIRSITAPSSMRPVLRQAEEAARTAPPPLITKAMQPQVGAVTRAARR